MLVFDDHGGSRKDKQSSRIGRNFEGRVVHGAAEGADGDASDEDQAVDARHAADPFIVGGSRTRAFGSPPRRYPPATPSPARDQVSACDDRTPHQWQPSFSGRDRTDRGTRSRRCPVHVDRQQLSDPARDSSRRRHDTAQASVSSTTAGRDRQSIRAAGRLSHGFVELRHQIGPHRLLDRHADPDGFHARASAPSCFRARRRSVGVQPRARYS